MPENKTKNLKLKAKNNGKRTQKTVATFVPGKKIVSKIAEKKEARLSAPVFTLNGTKKGTVSLRREMFGAKINKKLMAQAVRVYLVNQRQGTASTKTRGEVRGSTRKIYRQKGTGRARHGAITAPIFVGGGIAFGPRPRKFELKLSKQMKKKALFSALSQKLIEDKVRVVDEAGASGKTKEIIVMLKTMDIFGKVLPRVLFVADSLAARGAQNIKNVDVRPANSLNIYEVLKNNYLLISKNSLEKLTKIYGGEE